MVEYITDLDHRRNRNFPHEPIYPKEGLVVDKVKAGEVTFFLVIDEFGNVSPVNFKLIKKVIPVTEFEKFAD